MLVPGVPGCCRRSAWRSPTSAQRRVRAVPRTRSTSSTPALEDVVRRARARRRRRRLRPARASPRRRPPLPRPVLRADRAGPPRPAPRRRLRTTPHERRYGHRIDDEPVELVNAARWWRRSRPSAVAAEPRRAAPASRAAPSAAASATQVDAAVHDRTAMGRGSTAPRPGDRRARRRRPAWCGPAGPARVDDVGTLVLEAGMSARPDHSRRCSKRARRDRRGDGRRARPRAYSSNIKERRDCSAALFDAAGRMVAQAEHIPVHLGAMPESVAAVIARDPRPGDVVGAERPLHRGHPPARRHARQPRRRRWPGRRVRGDARPPLRRRRHVARLDAGRLAGAVQEGSGHPTGAPHRRRAGPDLPANSRTPRLRRGDFRAQAAANRDCNGSSTSPNGGGWTRCSPASTTCSGTPSDVPARPCVRCPTAPTERGHRARRRRRHRRRRADRGRR